MRMALAACVLYLLGLSAPLCADQTPPVIITPLASTKTTASGRPITVPPYPVVVVSRYEIAPRVSLPIHEHPYPRYAYVLAGTLEVTVIGGKTYRYKAGDFFAEVIDEWHTGRNTGDTPVRLLVIDQVPPGHSNTILRSQK